MTFQELIEKIESSKVFQKFNQEHQDNELVAGFFVLDFLSNDTKQTLDYKTDNKIFTFDLKGEDILMKQDELLDTSDKQPLQKIDKEIKVEVDELKSIAGVQALDNGIHSKFHKIIAVLQKHRENPESEQLQVWNLTCMLEQLIILHILIDANTGKTIKFERKSMMDFVKKK